MVLVKQLKKKIISSITLPCIDRSKFFIFEIINSLFTMRNMIQLMYSRFTNDLKIVFKIEIKHRNVTLLCISPIVRILLQFLCFIHNILYTFQKLVKQNLTKTKYKLQYFLNTSFFFLDRRANTAITV